MAARTEERIELDHIAMTVAGLMIEYRKKFGHSPVIVQEFANQNGRPDRLNCSELQVLGATKESAKHTF